MKIYATNVPAEEQPRDAEPQLFLRESIFGNILSTLSAARDEGYLGTLTIKGRPREIRERLKAMWTTLGVVSALFAGIGLPTVLNPKQGWQSREDSTTVAQVMVYSIAISFGLSFTVVIICTMLTYSIDLMPTEQSINVFILRFQYLSNATTMLFIFSTAGMVVGFIASIYYNYGWRPFVIMLTYFSVLIAFLGISFLRVHSFNTLVILEYRYSCKRSSSGPKATASVVVQPQLPPPHPPSTSLPPQ